MRALGALAMVAGLVACQPTIRSIPVDEASAGRARIVAALPGGGVLAILPEAPEDEPSGVLVRIADDGSTEEVLRTGHPISAADVDVDGSIVFAEERTTGGSPIRRLLPDGTIVDVDEIGDDTIERLDVRNGAIFYGFAFFTGVAGGSWGPATFVSDLAPDGTLVYGGTTCGFDSCWSDHTVRRMDLATGTSEVLAGRPGVSASAGDGGPAADATFTSVRSISVADDGSILVLDGEGRVRRIAGGTITTVAGTGEVGSSGDGGAATQAEIRAGTVEAAPGGAFYVQGPTVEGEGSGLRKVGGEAAPAEAIRAVGG